ncbi:MAG: Asp-tRNA(Asn)/Glu-tRNA(Gln) amidotransferase subunit GatA [bacterium]|nr:Asp-tRNA(Asn)/Glu-tRNA(Gln) amidotransferase subunit GatA [bacterium]
MAAGEFTAVELAREALDRIATLDGRLNSFVTLTPERALAQAEAVDNARTRGETLGPLAGIPMALKDNLCTRGILTTCSSRALKNHVPPYDATAWCRLEAAGAVLLGKTNLDEFAMGSSTENSAFFPTGNPWDPGRVPGGSSGGSAAAVASGEVVYALGSDTGGSIRQPAALTGVVGLKPTYGRVSRYGLVAFASSLDQVGPLARTVADCARVLQVIAGHDPLDSTSLPAAVPDYVPSLTGDVRGLKIGVPTEYFGMGVDPEVASLVRAGIEVLAGLGAEVAECSLPTTAHALAAYYVLAPAEASSNLARYDGVSYGHRATGGRDLEELYTRSRQEGLGAEVKRRIMLGTYVLSRGYYDAYYLKAQRVRALVSADFEQALGRFDLLASPTSPEVAFARGERAGDLLRMYMADACTIPVNLAGLPAISVPCGFSRGLPVGLQLIGRQLAEATLLRAAHAYEAATPQWRRVPPLAAGQERGWET